MAPGGWGGRVRCGGPRATQAQRQKSPGRGRARQRRPPAPVPPSFRSDALVTHPLRPLAARTAAQQPWCGRGGPRARGRSRQWRGARAPWRALGGLLALRPCRRASPRGASGPGRPGGALDAVPSPALAAPAPAPPPPGSRAHQDREEGVAGDHREVLQPPDAGLRHQQARLRGDRHHPEQAPAQQDRRLHHCATAGGGGRAGAARPVQHGGAAAAAAAAAGAEAQRAASRRPPRARVGAGVGACAVAAAAAAGHSHCSSSCSRQRAHAGGAADACLLPLPHRST
jgi:hypothetical protein